MQQKEPGRNGPLGPRERAGLVSFAPAAASAWRGTDGLLAARYRDVPAAEISMPPSTHHSLVLVHRPSEVCEYRYDDVVRRVPPPAGAILVGKTNSPIMGLANIWRAPHRRSPRSTVRRMSATSSPRRSPAR